MNTRPVWLNPAMWVLALVVINTAWFFVTEQEAPIELNTSEQRETFRSFALDGALSSDDPMPVRLVMSISAEASEQANFSYVLRLDNHTVVTEWTGTVGEAPKDWKGTLVPGTYVLETQLTGEATVEQTLMVAPFKPLQILGHIALSVGLVLLALAEQGVRGLIRRRAEARPNFGSVERSPFKPLKRGMPDADHQLVDDSPWREPVR